MELRFYISDGLKLLQQKWVGHHAVAITEGPNLQPKVEFIESGEFEWRDIPLVEEKTDDLAG